MKHALLRLAGAGLMLLAGMGLLLWNFSKEPPRPEATLETTQTSAGPDAPTPPPQRSEAEPAVPRAKAPSGILVPSPAPEQESGAAHAAEQEQPAPVPGPWHSLWPTRFHPEVFTAASDQAFEYCPSDPRYRYEGVDCQSAPCLLLFQVRRDQERAPGDWEAVDTIVEQCEPWATDYPTETGRLTRCSYSMDCEGGAAWTLAIAPNAAVNLTLKHEELTPEDWKARLQTRCATLAEELGCPE